MTKITNTTTIIDHTTLQPSNDFLPVGRIGVEESMAIAIASILAYLGESSYIVDGNTKMQVYSGENGYVTLVIDEIIRLKITKNALIPAISNLFSLGDATHAIKDIHLRGKLLLGSDALGDVYYNNGTKFERLPIGTTGEVLSVVSGIPAWASVTGGASDLFMTIAELRAYSSTIKEYVLITDPFLYGLFKGVSSSDTDDGIMILQDASGNVYKRVDKNIYPSYFGAMGDGVTNDLTAFEDMFNYITTQRVVLEPTKNYLITGKLIISKDNLAPTHEPHLHITGYGAQITTGNIKDSPVIELRKCKKLTLEGILIDGDVSFNGAWFVRFNDVRLKGAWFSNGLLSDGKEIYWSSFNNTFFTKIVIQTGTHILGNPGQLREFNSINFNNCNIFADDPDGTNDYAIEVYGTGNMQAVKFTGCDLSYQGKAKLYINEEIYEGSLTFDSCYFDDTKGFPIDTKNLVLNFVNCAYIQEQAPVEQRTTEASRTTLDTIAVIQGLGSRRPTSSSNLIINGDLKNNSNDLNIIDGVAVTEHTGYGYFNNYIKCITIPSQSGFPRVVFKSIPVPFTGWYSLVVVARNNKLVAPGFQATSTVSHIYNSNSSLDKTIYGVVRFPYTDIMGDIAGWAVSSWQVKLVANEEFDLNVDFFDPGGIKNVNIDIAYVGLTYGKNGLLGAPLHHNASYIGASKLLGNSALTRDKVEDIIVGYGLTLDEITKQLIVDFTKGMSYNESADLPFEIGSTTRDSVADRSIYSWRFFVSGSAVDGQDFKLQYKRYISGGIDVWEDALKIYRDGAGAIRFDLSATVDNAHLIDITNPNLATEYSISIDLSSNTMQYADIDVADLVSNAFNIDALLTLPTTGGTIIDLQLNVVNTSGATSGNVVWKYGAGVSLPIQCWKDDTPLVTLVEDTRYNITFKCFGTTVNDVAIEYFSRSLV